MVNDLGFHTQNFYDNGAMAKKSKKDRKAAKRKQRIKEQKHQRRSQGNDWPYGPGFERGDEDFTGMGPYADDELSLIGVSGVSGVSSDLGYADPFAMGAGMGHGFPYPDESRAPIGDDALDLDDLLDLNNMDAWTFESLIEDRRIAAQHAFHQRLLSMVAFDASDQSSWSAAYASVVASSSLYQAWEALFRLQKVHHFALVIGPDATVALMDGLFRQVDELAVDDPRGPANELAALRLLNHDVNHIDYAALEHCLDRGIDELRAVFKHDPLRRPSSSFTDPREASLVRLQAMRLQCDLLHDRFEAVQQVLGNDEPLHQDLADIAILLRILRHAPAPESPLEQAICAGNIAPLKLLELLLSSLPLTWMANLPCPYLMPLAHVGRLSTMLWDRVLAPWGGQGAFALLLAEQLANDPEQMPDERDTVPTAVSPPPHPLPPSKAPAPTAKPDPAFYHYPWPPLDPNHTVFFDGLPAPRQTMVRGTKYEIPSLPKPKYLKEGRAFSILELSALPPNYVAEVIAIYAAENIWSMEPWNVLSENNILILHEGGRRWYIQVIGQHGEQPGVLFHRGDAGLRQVHALFQGLEAGVAAMAQQETLALHFTDRENLNPDWHKILKQASRRYRGKNRWPEWSDLRIGYLPAVPDNRQLSHTAVLVDAFVAMFKRLITDQTERHALFAHSTSGLMRHRDWQDGAWLGPWQAGLPRAAPLPSVRINEVTFAEGFQTLRSVSDVYHLRLIPFPTYLDKKASNQPLPMLIALFNGANGMMLDHHLHSQLATPQSVIDVVIGFLKKSGRPQCLVISDPQLATILKTRKAITRTAIRYDPHDPIGQDFAERLLREMTH